MKKVLLLLSIVFLIGIYARQTQAAIGPPSPPPIEDEDNDGVLDEVDICTGTVEETNLIENHYIWIGGKNFVTKDPKTKEIVKSKYSIEETKGCSCAQILAKKSGETKGQQEHGCSEGIMKNAVK